MEITATFASGMPLTVSVSASQADACVESFFEMGALTVTVK